MKTNNLKRALAVFLSALMILGAAPAVFAAGGEGVTGCTHADAVDGKHVPKANSAVVTDPTCEAKGYTTYTCSLCDQTYTDDETDMLPHEYELFNLDETHHVNKCKNCSYIDNDSKEEHTKVWKHDNTHHWEECGKNCGYQTEKAEHTVTNWSAPVGGVSTGTCTVCNGTITKTVASEITITFMNGTKVIYEGKTTSGGKITYGGPNPTKTETTGMTYDFSGWSSTDTNIYGPGTRIVNMSTQTFSENTTLYAVFTQHLDRLQDVQITLNRNATSYTLSTAVSGTSSISSQVSSKLSGSMGGSLYNIELNAPSSASNRIGTLYADSSRTPLSTTKLYTASEFGSMYFVPRSSGTFYIDYTAYNQYGHSISGMIAIATSGASSNNEIRYEVPSNDTVTFLLSDFSAFFSTHYSSASYPLRYVQFGSGSDLSASNGYLYFNYGRNNSQQFTATNITSYDFYYNSASYGDYPLSSLTFVPGSRTGSYTVEIPFTAYYDRTHYASGIVVISVGGVSGGDVVFTVGANRTVDLSAAAFRDYFEKNYSGYDFTHVVFGSSSLGSSDGYIYYDYNGSGSYMFSASALTRYSFYYSSRTYGDYPLDGLTFVSGTRSGSYSVEIPFTAYSGSSRSVTGRLVINVNDSSSLRVVYTVASNGTVAMTERAFSDFFNKEYPGYSLRYVRFGAGSDLGASYGYMYYNLDGRNQERFTNSTIANYDFYLGNNSSYGNYPLDGLTFVPGTRTGSYTVEIPFTAYHSNSVRLNGTLVIEVGSVSGGQVKLTVARDSTLTLTDKPFADLFEKRYSGYNLRYVRFNSGSNLGSSYGYLYYNYGKSSQRQFTSAGINSYYFYTGKNTTLGDYPLSELTFVPGTRSGKYSLEIDFTAYYDSSRVVTGTLVIEVTDAVKTENFDILYNTISKDPVAIRAKDFADFFKKTYPSYTLSYVELGGVPATGTLYYDRASTNGALTLTNSNYGNYSFYYAPNSSQRDLDRLTYVPSGKNYCVMIPFTAYASSNRSVSGNIMISVSNANLSDVYAVTTKGAKVSLSGSNFNTKLNAAVGQTFSYIKFAALPAASEGTLYYNYTSANSYGHKVDKNNSYYYSSTASGAYLVNNISFVPTSGYTGSITLPYVAYNSAGTAIAAGNLSLGVVNQIKSYSDVSGSNWFYKYVVELSDAGVVNGYPAGNFQPNGDVKYGEALKLIMLAVGYNEQPAPAGTHWATGYMNRAISDGLITNAVSNLNSTISRQAVAQIAVRAMRLTAVSSSGSSVFKDTNDANVLTLFKAGIVEGSFDSAGDRYYYPTKTITRAEVSAIIWRINQYSK